MQHGVGDTQQDGYGYMESDLDHTDREAGTVFAQQGDVLLLTWTGGYRI